MVPEVRPRFVRTKIVSIVRGAAFFASLGVIGGTPELALVFLFVIPVAVRLGMVHTWVDGDRLRVRNLWSSFDRHRSEIAGFGLGHDFGDVWGIQLAVVVSLVDGRTRRLSATARLRRIGRLSSAEICDELNRWLQRGA